MASESFYRYCLNTEFTRRRENNPQYSLRAFSRSLGFDASVISQVLAGKRVPSLKTAKRLAEALKLSTFEKERFFVSLAEVQKERGLRRMNPHFKTLSRYPAQEIDLEVFKIISDWYHYAILEMTQLDGFQTTLENLSKELKLSKKEIKAAIGRLKKLKLLNESNGRLKKTKNFINTADQHLSAPALKKRQRQVLEKAICSLEMDSVEKRNITAWTMPVDPKKIPEAKKMIQEFHKSLCEFLSSGRKKKVYEMSISLFPLH